MEPPDPTGPSTDAAGDDARMQAIGERLARGAALGIVRVVGVYGVGLLATTLLARRFGPATWGTYAAVWSICGLLVGTLVFALRDRMAGDIGSGDRSGDDTARVATALACALAAIGAIATGALYASGVHGMLPGLVAAGSLWVATVALRLPAIVLALREVRAGTLVLLEAIDPIAAQGGAAIAAGLGAGRDSFAIGIVTASVVGMAAAHFVAPLRVRGASVRILGGAARAALPLSLHMFLSGGRDLLLPPVLAIVAGTAVAGVYGFALPLAAAVSLLLAVAAQPAYGALTTLMAGEDRARAARLTDGIATLLAIVAAVGIGWVHEVVPWFVPAVFGDHWSRAVPVVALAMTGAALSAVAVPYGNVAVAWRDGNATLARIQAVATSIVLVAVAIFARRWLPGVAVGYVIGQFTLLVLLARAADRRLRIVGWWRPAVAVVTGGAGAIWLGGGLARHATALPSVGSVALHLTIATAIGGIVAVGILGPRRVLRDLAQAAALMRGRSPT